MTTMRVANAVLSMEFRRTYRMIYCVNILLENSNEDRMWSNCRLLGSKWCGQRDFSRRWRAGP